MAETTTRISIFERASSTLMTVITIAGVGIGGTMWLAHLESGIAEAKAATLVVGTAQLVETARIDHIEESRMIGLQRLAKAEEAVAGLQATLNRIDAKLDALRGR